MGIKEGVRGVEHYQLYYMHKWKCYKIHYFDDEITTMKLFHTLMQKKEKFHMLI
jgi:transcription-repair coupling factor (superfamily II helicase)